MHLITRVHRVLLLFYPSGFQTEFGEKMQDVFATALTEAQRPSRAVDVGDKTRTVFVQAVQVHGGTSRALRFFLRELKDLPGSLLRQHWLAIKKEKVPMNTLTESNGIPIKERQPGTWGAVFLAGLPHLLMSLLIGIGKLGILDTYQVSKIGKPTIGIELTLLVIGILIYAWRRGWPLWSASWYLYGTWVVLVVVGLTIESLDLEDSWRYTNAMLLGWILLCIIGYFVVLSKSKLHGLLSVAFLFPLLSVTMLEFVPNPIEGWLAIGVGLLAALVAGTIVRIGELRPALGLVLGLNLAVGPTWAYIGEYKMLDLPPGAPAYVPKFSSFLEMLALYSIFSLGIVALPFIIHGLWNFGRRKLAS
jgi:hypothetical protein